MGHKHQTGHLSINDSYLEHWVSMTCYTNTTVVVTGYRYGGRCPCQACETVSYNCPTPSTTGCESLCLVSSVNDHILTSLGNLELRSTLCVSKASLKETIFTKSCQKFCHEVIA